MIRKSQLALFVAIAISCSTSYAQTFSRVAPSDLGLSQGESAINQVFDISSILGTPNGSVSLTVQNGFVSATSDSWTVSETESTNFSFSGLEIGAFINHGANLGSQSFQNGSQPRDGITTLNGETWTLTSTIDDDYTPSFSGNDYFVDYTGDDTGNLESNGDGFRWQSDEAARGVTVFSTNTTDLNNNYTMGFRTISAVPEPASGMLLAVGALVFVRRKRC